MTEFRKGDVVEVCKKTTLSSTYKIGDRATYIGDDSYRMFDGLNQYDWKGVQFKLIRRAMKYELGQKFTSKSFYDIEIIEVNNGFYHGLTSADIKHYTDDELGNSCYTLVTNPSDTTTITLASGEKKTISVASAKELGLL